MKPACQHLQKTASTILLIVSAPTTPEAGCAAYCLTQRRDNGKSRCVDRAKDDLRDALAVPQLDGLTADVAKMHADRATVAAVNRPEPYEQAKIMR